MGRAKKTYDKIMSGANTNIDFQDFRNLVSCLGFKERIRGDHHYFSQPDISEAINIQPDGNKAKPYQIRQVREIILKYKLEV